MTAETSPVQPSDTIYILDNDYQGYFKTDKIANRGRLINTIDLCKHVGAYLLHPIKMVAWLVTGIISVIIFCIYTIYAIISSYKNNTYLKKHTIQSLFKFSANCFIFIVYNLICLVFKVFIIAGLLLGIALPEVGKKMRAAEKAYQNFFEDYFFLYQKETNFNSPEEALGVLRLPPTKTSPEVIDEKWKTLSIQYHPDKISNKSVQELQRLILEAFNALGLEERKKWCSEILKIDATEEIETFDSETINNLINHKLEHSTLEELQGWICGVFNKIFQAHEYLKDLGIASLSVTSTSPSTTSSHAVTDMD